MAFLMPLACFFAAPPCPVSPAAYSSIINYINKNTPADEVISDLIVGYRLIGYCVPIAVGISFLIAILMR